MFHNMRWLVLQHPVSEMYRSCLMRTAITHLSAKRTLTGKVQVSVIPCLSVNDTHLSQCGRTRTICSHQQYIPQCSAIFHSHMTIPWSLMCTRHQHNNSSTDSKLKINNKNVKKDEPKTVAYVEAKKKVPTRRREKLEKRQIVDVKDNMTLKQLAFAMNADKEALVNLLHANGIIRKKYFNEILRRDKIKQIVHFMKMSYRFQAKSTPEKLVPAKKVSLDATRRPPPDPSVLVTRPPVVTIMGHVDHGKTTLLDTLRKTSVAAGEAGGITQHIGAFSVELDTKHQITFLDTPGHAAFSAMRERGANVTDIVVLVVAADDSVMEQTRESLRFADNAKVPLVVAINKCDKPHSDPDITKRDLLSHGVQLEEFGGDVQAVEISALKGTNIATLMEAIITLAEVQEIQGDPTGHVEAVVIESSVDKGKGAIATLVVQRGTLERGSVLVAGKSMCKVRAMFNDKEQRIQKAPPGTPVEVSGWRDVPSAGDGVLQVKSESRAKEVIKWRQDQEEEIRMKSIAVELEKEAASRPRKHFASQEERRQAGYQQMTAAKGQPLSRPKEVAGSDDPELNIVIKGDVDGSVEAILDALSTYDAHQQCKLNILQYGVGSVTAKDIELAQTFSGAVVGFNVTASMDALKLAQESNVTLMMHNIIYRLMDDVRENCNSRLPPIMEEVFVGEATVLLPFQITVGSRKLPIAGCKVTKGSLLSSGTYKIIRDNETIHTGPLASLKHKKDDVNSVKKEMECGLRFKKQIEYLPGDVIVCYNDEEVPQKIEWELGF